jgi:hypothetical protein
MSWSLVLLSHIFFSSRHSTAFERGTVSIAHRRTFVKLKQGSNITLRHHYTVCDSSHKEAVVDYDITQHRTIPTTSCKTHSIYCQRGVEETRFRFPMFLGTMHSFPFQHTMSQPLPHIKTRQNQFKPFAWALREKPACHQILATSTRCTGRRACILFV